MTKRLLTSGAALMLGLWSAGQPVAHAQDAGEVPLCENPNGRLWNDIVNPRAYDKLPDFKEPGEGALAALSGIDLSSRDGAICLIEFDGAELYVTGKRTGNGKIVVQKGDVLEAAERTGIRIHSKRDQQNEAAQQGNTRPEQNAQAGAGNDGRGGDGSLLDKIEEEVRAQAEAENQPEVRQEDTDESTQAANQTVQAEAATSDADDDGRPESVEVETRTVTEADTRSSAEDFTTSANAKAVESDDGLSNFEKFALGALGAVAAGQLLDSGDRVVSNSGDRVVVERQDGEFEVLKDDNALLRRPGTEVTTERFGDGSTRETLTRRNGAKIVTIKAADGQVLLRKRILPDGREVVLFDDTARVEPVELSELPEPRSQMRELNATDTEELRMALAAQENRVVERRFSLRQIRQIRAVRELVPEIELEAVNFETASAAIRPSEAEELRDLGVAMQRLIEENPYEVFLVEGHTDAVGSATYNLALSDRRAESVALALTEYFDVPPENMVVQGYGESNLKIRTLQAERENRRATVRRITPLLRTASQ